MENKKTRLFGETVVSVGAAFTLGFLLFEFRPWAEGAVVMVTNLIGISIIAIWALSPYLLFLFLLRKKTAVPKQIAITAWLSILPTLMALFWLTNVVLLHRQEQGALIFLVLPAWQHIFSIVAVIAYLVLRNKPG